MGPLTPEDWRVLMTALIALCTALTAYVTYLTHRRRP